MANQSEILNFEDGDTLIYLSPTKQCRLHSRTLKTHSIWFEQHLVDAYALQFSTRTKRPDPHIIWRLDLMDPHEGGGPYGGFKFIREYSAPFRWRSAGLTHSRLPNYYENIFRAMHYQPLDLSDPFGGSSDLSMHTFTVSEIIKISSAFLQCLPIVQKPLELVLLNWGQELYINISKQPCEWASRAMKLRSETIFKEAIVHAVGKWFEWQASPPEAGLNAFDALHEDIQGLIVLKVELVKKTCSAVDIRLLGHYPQCLKSSEPVGLPAAEPTTTEDKKYKAHKYQAEVFAWMALNLFRHWLGQQIVANKTAGALDGGWAFYNAIAQGGSKYIGQESVNNFCRRFPLTPKALTQFMRALNDIKEDAKEIVAILLHKQTMLDTTRVQADYYTFIDVAKSEMPWYDEEEAKHEARRAGKGKGSGVTGSGDVEDMQWLREMTQKRGQDEMDVDDDEPPFEKPVKKPRRIYAEQGHGRDAGSSHRVSSRRNGEQEGPLQDVDVDADARSDDEDEGGDEYVGADDDEADDEAEDITEALRDVANDAQRVVRGPSRGVAGSGRRTRR